MAVATTVSGTLARTAASDSAATGTASVVGSTTGAFAAGSLDIDRTLFLAFYARVRLTRPDVFIDTELMRNLVDTVELDSSLEDPIDYATFTLSDPRVAFFDPLSVSNGERVVAIDFWSGPPGAVLQWHAFLGNTETSQNTMPYRPRGVFKCVSLSAKWADLLGCLNVHAFSGLTRGQILAAFFESAGVTLANADSLGGGIVTKKIDIAGKTPFDLVKEFGEIEGWFARTTDDGTGLEIISEDTMMDGAPIFYFDESNTFDVPETCPDRPVTDWILSATRTARVSTAVDSTGSSIMYLEIQSPRYGGNTIVETITDHGVEIKSIVTQYETVVPQNEPGGFPQYMIVNRVTTESVYEPYTWIDVFGLLESMPARLNSKRTTTETLSGSPCSSNFGYLWDNGSRMMQGVATLQVTEIIDETYTWDDATCTQTSSLIVTQQLYSPLYGYGGYEYIDGTFRATYVYGMTEISREYTFWVDMRPSGASRVEKHIESSKWYVTTIGHEVYGVFNTAVTSTPAISGGVGLGEIVASPPVGANSSPQTTEEVITYEFDATDASGYTKRTEAPGLLVYPENIAELDSIARRRIRRACSDELAIPHNCIPFLRVGDHVSVTNRARNLILADAYVWTIKRTADVTNGAMRQVTTVKIPPSWI